MNQPRVISVSRKGLFFDRSVHRSVTPVHLRQLVIDRIDFRVREFPGGADVTHQTLLVLVGTDLAVPTKWKAPHVLTDVFLLDLVALSQMEQTGRHLLRLYLDFMLDALMARDPVHHWRTRFSWGACD